MKLSKRRRRHFDGVYNFSVEYLPPVYMVPGHLVEVFSSLTLLLYRFSLFFVLGLSRLRHGLFHLAMPYVMIISSPVSSSSTAGQT